MMQNGGPHTQLEATSTSKKTQDSGHDVVHVNAVGAIAVTIASFIYGNISMVEVLTPDPRTEKWSSMQSPLPTLIMSLIYVLSVTWLGPRFMKDRKAFQLRNIMIVYNSFQVIFSFYLFWECGMAGWFKKYSWRCQQFDLSEKPDNIRMVNNCYWYYMSKFVDFLDTIFFVLHKKYDHISLLHVLHHSCMPISCWHGVRYSPGGHYTLFGFLNSFVHVVMYFYYLLAAIGPSVRRFLWWKKYVTALQLIQFVTIFVHSAQLFFTDCNAVPIAITRWVCMYSLMFLCLFINFYIKSYQRRQNIKNFKKSDCCNGLANGHSNGIPKTLVNELSQNGISSSKASNIFNNTRSYVTTTLHGD